MVAPLPVKLPGGKDLTAGWGRRRMLRAGGYRREAGRAACRLDVSDGVDAIYLPTKLSSRVLVYERFALRVHSAPEPRK